MGSNLEKRLADFDPFIASADDPRHKAMIRNFQLHNEYEQTGNIEGLLSLYTDDAEFHVYGAVFGPNRETHIKGKAAIRERYERMFSTYVARSSDPDTALEHLMASDWGIAGIFRSTFEAPGSLLAVSHDIGDDQATYRIRQHLAFFRACDDDRVSSMTYINSQPSLEKLG